LDAAREACYALIFNTFKKEIFSVWPFAAELSENAWVAARPEN